MDPIARRPPPILSRGVPRVVMEATADYLRAPSYLLEDRFETWLVNAKDVKHLPGRPKTDRLDAVWLCKVAERQMLRPSFVPPPALSRRPPTAPTAPSRTDGLGGCGNKADG
jgi:transposase